MSVRPGVSKPMTKPRATVLASTGQSRCTRRLAKGGDSSHPSAASSGGFAAATTRTASGNAMSPTTRSRTTRNMAACTAGGAVVSSSRNNSPHPAATRRRAHNGGAIWTAPSITTGSPAKSAGSRSDPITTSIGQPRALANACTTEVFPVPGLPHKIAGTPAATHAESASPTAHVSIIAPPASATPSLRRSSHLPPRQPGLLDGDLIWTDRFGRL